MLERVRGRGVVVIRVDGRGGGCTSQKKAMYALADFCGCMVC